ncbi:hypothetical protein PR202_gb12882 [Eleusine coracana subsp. coracana]|uniref:Uncharacterized protein n=1 Tax=Eleusine coracana subsp. coracana TaxID=191504 RepID=A0AAV5ESA3_ELECO|nr:hypothetical protein PR202_gb12882 [Eleusine coracana subsp. coracana]
MRKKGRAAVPEWLNSPMWSVPQPPPAPPDPYGADLAPPPPPPPKPAAPAVPPPPSYAEAVGERGGRRRGHEVEEDEDDGLAGAVIRAHLLADFKAALSKKVINMGELRRLACLGVPDGGAGVRPIVWKQSSGSFFIGTGTFFPGTFLVVANIFSWGAFFTGVFF